MLLSRFIEEETEAQWGWIIQSDMANKWQSQELNSGLSWLKLEPFTIRMYVGVLFLQSPLPIATCYPQGQCHQHHLSPHPPVPGITNQYSPLSA